MDPGTPVERGHQPHRRIGEGGANLTEILRPHPDIAVADDNQVVPCQREGVHQVADLMVGTVFTVIHHQIDGDTRELRHELPDHRQRRIIPVGQGEDDLKNRVLLTAE